MRDHSKKPNDWAPAPTDPVFVLLLPDDEPDEGALAEELGTDDFVAVANVVDGLAADGWKVTTADEPAAGALEDWPQFPPQLREP